MLLRQRAALGYKPYYNDAVANGYLTEALGNIALADINKDLTREEAVALIMAYMDPDIDVST